MRIAVFGAGGVGGYFGARLARAGHDVAFIARGRHLAAIRANGLRVETAAGDFAVESAVATDSTRDVTNCDVVMFCVKLWDVEEAAAQVGPMLAPAGVAIPFQNGVESPAVLARHVGPQHTLGGVAYIAATIRTPGVIAHTGTMAGLRVGAFAGGPSHAAASFVRACVEAGFDAQQSPDIERTLWEKFVFLSAMAGCTSLTRQPVGGIRSDPDVRAVFAAAMNETIAVGRARGISFAEDFAARQLTFLDGLPAQMRSSMLNDLVAGNRLEAPWLAGAVVRMSAQAGLPAPVNATIYAALKPYLNGRSA